MLIGFLIIIIGGTVRIGGAAEGWRRAKEGQRTQLVDFNFDPTVRYTFWTIMIGGTFFYTMLNGSKQAVIQRYNSCKTEREAKLVAWIGIIGMGVVEMLAVICGMVAFAWYAYCDPLTTGRITSRDQLVPLLVMDLFHGIPGLPGIAIAGACCASLSSVSSLINSLAAVIGETIIKNYWTDMSEASYTRLMKFISAFLGLISIGIALLTSFLGGVIQIVLSLGGIFGGPGFGVICLGVFVPRADARSALSGLIVAVIVGLSLEIGARVTGSRSQSNLPVSVERCESLNTSHITEMPMTYQTFTDLAPADYYSETTGFSDVTASEAELHVHRIAIFAISNLHYSTISTVITFIVGVLVSYLPGGKGADACDSAHLTPMVQKYFLKSREEKEGTKKGLGNQYQEVPTEMEDISKNV